MGAPRVPPRPCPSPTPPRRAPAPPSGPSSYDAQCAREHVAALQWDERHAARQLLLRDQLVWRRWAQRLRALPLPTPPRPRDPLLAAATVADDSFPLSGGVSSGDDDDDDAWFSCESSDDEDGGHPTPVPPATVPSDTAAALAVIPPWVRQLYWRYSRAAQVCLATPGGRAQRSAEAAPPADERCASPTCVLLAFGRAFLAVRTAADSGSPFSFISKAVFAEILRASPEWERPRLLPPRPLVASSCGADGSRLNILGRCCVRVDIDGTRVDAEFHVMDGMAVPAILGNDHLLPWGARMDWSARTLELRALGVLLPLQGLPEAAPGYGELLDIVAVEAAVVPLYHESMVPVCLMTPDGRRVCQPLVGDMLGADFAQLSPPKGVAAFPEGTRLLPLSNMHPADTPSGCCNARRVLPGERVGRLRVRVAAPVQPVEPPAAAPPGTRPASRGPRPAFASHGPQLRRWRLQQESSWLGGPNAPPSALRRRFPRRADLDAWVAARSRVAVRQAEARRAAAAAALPSPGHSRVAIPLSRWARASCGLLHGGRDDDDAPPVLLTPPTPTATPAERAVCERYRRTLHELEVFHPLTADGDVAEQHRLADLVWEYLDIFDADVASALGHTGRAFRIDTGDSPPVRAPTYRRSPRETAIIEAAVRKMLAQGVISPCASPWAASVVLARKPDGSWRFCCDYRKLNAVTVRDCYPLPRIDAVLGMMAGSEWFSSHDLTSSFWQTRMCTADGAPGQSSSRDKTAFVVPSGQYAWNFMPFGLRNATAHQQRAVDEDFGAVHWRSACTYVDDTNVFSAGTVADHVVQLRAFYDCVRGAGMRLKPSKCRLARRRIHTLGHEVDGLGHSPGLTKAGALRDYKRPHKRTELRSFLGLAAYFSEYIDHFADLSEPLRRVDVRRPGKKLQWGPEQQAAFESIRSAMTTPQVMRHPQYGAEAGAFIVKCDASHVGLGAWLGQYQLDAEGRSRLYPICFASRAKSPAERLYPTKRSECLAVVWSLEKFRHFILGELFEVHTDHANLRWLRGQRQGGDSGVAGQLARWAIAIDQYAFTMVVKKGREMAVADALSRDPHWVDADATMVATRLDLLPSGATLLVAAAPAASTPCLCSPWFLATVGGGLCDPHFWDGDGTAIGVSLATTPGLSTAAPVLPVGLSHAATPRQQAMWAAAAAAQVAAQPAAAGPAVAAGVEWRWSTLAAATQHAATLASVATDELSLHMPSWPDAFTTETMLPDAHELRLAQLADPEYGPVLRSIESGDGGSTVVTAAAREVYTRDFRVVAGLLHHVAVISALPDSDVLQLVIPATMREALLLETHASVLGAHVGFAKLYGLLRRRYFWRGMWADARRVVDGCVDCLEAKSRLAPFRLGRTHLARYPFQRVHADLWDAGVTSTSGARYVLTVVDAMTRWVELIPLHNKEAATVARAFFRSVVCRHGVPAVVTTDNGTEFDAVFDQMMRLFGVRRVRTMPYMPRSNGAAERVHGMLRSSLMAMVKSDHACWDDHIDGVAFAYRSSPLAGSTFSPFYLMHGREPTLPGELVAEPPVRVARHETEFAADLRSHLGAAFALHRLQMERRAEQRHAGQPRPAGPQPVQARAPYMVGEQVIILRTARGLSPKLRRPFTGPFEVIRAAHPNYVVQAPGREARPVHAMHMRPDGLRTVRPSGRQPQLPRAASVAPPSADSRIAEGTMMLVAIADDHEPWRLVLAVEDSTPHATVRVHIYEMEHGHADPSSASWQPAYFDPRTGRDEVRQVPSGHLEAYVLDIPTSAVVLPDVRLTVKRRIRLVDLRRLSEVPRVRWSYMRRRGVMRPDLPGVGARVLKQFGGSMYAGVVQRLIPPHGDDDDPDPGCMHYHVAYDDGDAEDYTLAELHPLLEAHAASGLQSVRRGRAV